jgi:purine nucleosidase
VAALRPELFTTERMYGDVEIDGNLTYGATVFDRRRVPENQPNMDVAVDMDTAAVTDCIVRGLMQAA